jgi:hypothetical protein
MTLRPIPGAPIDAPSPDFPAGEPGSLGLPEPRFARRPGKTPLFSLPPSAAAPLPAPARRPGPVEIHDNGTGTLTFRCIPEVPAINRSSMTVSITGETAGDTSPRAPPHLDLATDEAHAFLLALRDGGGPVVIADSRTGYQLEFAIADDGPVFTVTRPGQTHSVRRFALGLDTDAATMAAHLLAELGP